MSWDVNKIVFPNSLFELEEKKKAKVLKLSVVLFLSKKSFASPPQSCIETLKLLATHRKDCMRFPTRLFCKM